MPKKGKKTGKGKKGKKASKGPKKDKDVELSMAIANAKLWTSRYEIAEKCRSDYRETYKRMADDNERLHKTLSQTEKDTIEVVTYLKQGDIEKNEKIMALQQDIINMKEQAKLEKTSMIDEFSSHVSDLETRLEQKTKEVEVMQYELKLVKEFRRKRAQMETELDKIRESLHAAKADHSEALFAIEDKFLTEKQRLEKDASDKIADLAERAHTDAIANLDEKTRSIYKENIRLNESLKYHTWECESLKQQGDSLAQKASEFRLKKEKSDLVVREKVSESKRQKQDLAELKDKVKNLEISLKTMANDFCAHQRQIEQSSETRLVSCNEEIKRVRRIHELKKQEINKMKVVAKRIVNQRSWTELYFMDSLNQVLAEAAMEKANYLETTQEAFHRKMITANSGHAEFPRLSSNATIDQDIRPIIYNPEGLHHEGDWVNLRKKIDVRQLTWEQKEKVLRLLFARMNSEEKMATQTVPCEKSPVPPLSTEHRPASVKLDDMNETVVDSEPSNTFITQQEPQENSTLPPIHSTYVKV